MASATLADTFTNNYLGTDPTGMFAIPNGYYGLSSSPSANTAVGPAPILQGNLISGNTRTGIFVGQGGVVLSGNRVGVKADGVTPLLNGNGALLNSLIPSPPATPGPLTIGSGNTIVGQVINNGVMDLGGNSLSIGYLSGGGTVTNSVAGTATLTIGNSEDDFFFGFGNQNKVFTGVIQNGTGAVAVTMIGTGTQALSEANTYSGATTINSGVLRAGVTNAFSANSAVTLANTAGTTLALNGFNNTIYSLAGGGATGGNVTLGSGTLTTGDTNATTTYAGVISGTFGGGLIKVGTGTFTLSGANTYIGATTINAGTLFVTGSMSSGGSAVTVNNSGTLGGTGTLNNRAVTVASGGFLAPGVTTGILSTGNVTLNSGSTFRVDVNGTTAGTGYDQLNVTGTVNLGGATLAATGTITPAGPTSLLLINNDGTDAVTGTFNGLAEGATVTINGGNFRISYVGGTGNDVVLISTNSAPTAIALSNSSLAENAGANAVVGTLSTTDPDAGDTFTYTLVTGTGSTDNGLFNISGGQLRANASFDFEAGSSYTVRVRSTDAGGLFAEQAFAITITNVNETPTAIALSNSSLAENAGANAVVGTLSTTDPDAGDTFTYTLVSGTGSTDNGLFNISGGQLRANAGFDFEAGSSYTVRVRSADAGGLFTEQQFAITITNVNEAPTAIAGTFTVAENAANGTSVGTAAGTDPDTVAPFNTLTYSLINDAGGRFAINATTGMVTVANGSLLNYETATSHAITVRVTDLNGASGGLTFDQGLHRRSYQSRPDHADGCE
jgi:autotransporter-associated beta strand protein